MTRAPAYLSAALCALLAAGAAGQSAPFPDPTRPPDVGAGAQLATQPASRLQSVLIAPGRRRAVINGKTVAIGSRVGDATVVRISPSAVVLEGAKGSETLKLYPAVEKTMLRRRHPAQAAPTGRSAEGGK